MLHDIKDIGISGKIGVFFANFVQGRWQCIAANRNRSSWDSVVSGVPQGTVLGPILFLILLNNIDENITDSRVTSFADDTRISRAIKTSTDCEKLQADLQKIYDWCQTNNMTLNSNKFELLNYGRDEDLKSFNYLAPNGDTIPKKHEVKDLGIILSDDFTFDAHICKMVQNVKRLMGWVLRTFVTRDRAHLLFIYKTLILPRIDYGSQLYYPYQRTLMSKVEQLQRHFTYQIEGVKDLNYYERLKELNLYSLHRRAERYKIIYIWKILEGIVMNFTNPILSKINPRTGRMVQFPSLHKKRGHLQTVQYNSFAFRAGRLFNSLPINIRNLMKVDTDLFKKHLDKYLITLPDTPPVLGYSSIVASIVEGGSLLRPRCS